MKTAVIGASGFIGSYLFNEYRTQCPDCIGTSFRHGHQHLIPFDLREPDIRPLRLIETGHEAVVIAAALTSFAECEQNPDAVRINVQGTLELIQQLGQLGVHVVFLSTDNVFDGRTGGYSDDCPPNPPTAYGRQKREVEQQIGVLCDRYTVVRLSKTLGLRRQDGTLLDEIASQLFAGRSISAAYDLLFNPTCVLDVVRSIVQVQERGVQGIINVASPVAWSRYDLAVAVADALKADTSLIRRVAYRDLGLIQSRSLNTSLNCDRLRRELEVEFTTVQTCVQRVAENWKQVSKEHS